MPGRFFATASHPEGLHVPASVNGALICTMVVDRNASKGVTWVHSYVSNDRMKTYDIYDAPNESSILEVAELNKMPVDKIMEVRVLDPYFYHGITGSV